MLEAEKDLAVCGMAGSAEQALPAITRLKPDLALLDISLPRKSGIELIRRIRARKLEVKLLVVSMHEEALFADRVLRAGGDGYIMKEEDPDEIVQAIRDVLAGRIYVSEAVMASRSKASPKRPAERATRPLSQLTDEQLEILELIGRGRIPAEIACELHLPPRTVSAQCAQIRRRLNLRSNAALRRDAAKWLQSQRA